MIDFGLANSQPLLEDKGVDLYVMERAFQSTHVGSDPLVRPMTTRSCSHLHIHFLNSYFRIFKNVLRLKKSYARTKPIREDPIIRFKNSLVCVHVDVNERWSDSQGNLLLTRDIECHGDSVKNMIFIYLRRHYCYLYNLPTHDCSSVGSKLESRPRLKLRISVSSTWT